MLQEMDKASQQVDAALRAFDKCRHPDVLALHYMDITSPYRQAAWVSS